MADAIRQPIRHNRKVDDSTIFAGIHQLMAPTDTPKKKIGFTIKEKQVFYSNKTKRKNK